MFYGPTAADYFLNNTLEASAVVWSACGTDVILRTNTNIVTRTNARHEQAMSTVDSIDISAGIRYLFQWQRCR